MGGVRRHGMGLTARLQGLCTLQILLALLVPVRAQQLRAKVSPRDREPGLDLNRRLEAFDRARWLIDSHERNTLVVQQLTGGVMVPKTGVTACDRFSEPPTANE